MNEKFFNESQSIGSPLPLKKGLRLRRYFGKRLRFSGMVNRFEQRQHHVGEKAYAFSVVGITDIIIVSQKRKSIKADFMWFKCGKWTDDLEVGHRVEFDARVVKAFPGYLDSDIFYDPLKDPKWLTHKEADYRLSRPSNVTYSYDLKNVSKEINVI